MLSRYHQQTEPKKLSRREPGAAPPDHRERRFFAFQEIQREE